MVERVVDMFTGIVEEMGTLRASSPNGGGARLEFEADLVLSDAELGSSIAVNGCCLTVVELGLRWWATDAVPETLDRTNLGKLQVGDPVNLERPLAASGRFGGHVVQGHVDTTATLRSLKNLADGSWLYEFETPEAVSRYVVEKGSVAVDGVSLTVAAITPTTFSIAIIPHTHEVTVLGRRKPGDTVNIEADILAKYIEAQTRAKLEEEQK